MVDWRYYTPAGGLPDQKTLLTGRAVFTDAYAVVPKDVLRDTVTSRLPFWEKSRAWVLARPMTGFAEMFSQYILDVEPGGGSVHPEPDKQVEGAFFVVDGKLTIKLGGKSHSLTAGGFAFLPAGTNYEVQNLTDAPVRFHWVRKIYQVVAGIAPPEPFFMSDAEVEPIAMPDTDGRWATTQFFDPDDLSYDMHVNIVTFAPGAVIPFTETHVMEHGLYVLQGKAVYRLNQDWVEVEAGDFMWLRAFCPQACYAGGPEQFRYLLYKDVNRHASLHPLPRN